MVYSPVPVSAGPNTFDLYYLSTLAISLRDISLQQVRLNPEPGPVETYRERPVEF